MIMLVGRGFHHITVHTLPLNGAAGHEFALHTTRCTCSPLHVENTLQHVMLSSASRAKHRSQTPFIAGLQISRTALMSGWAMLHRSGAQHSGSLNAAAAGAPPCTCALKAAETVARASANRAAAEVAASCSACVRPSSSPAPHHPKVVRSCRCHPAADQQGCRVSTPCNGT